VRRLDALLDSAIEDELTMREVRAELALDNEDVTDEQVELLLRRLVRWGLADLKWRDWPDQYSVGVAWEDVRRDLANHRELPPRHVILDLTDPARSLALDHQERQWRNARHKRRARHDP
jgi:hypothetical protein